MQYRNTHMASGPVRAEDQSISKQLQWMTYFSAALVIAAAVYFVQVSDPQNMANHLMGVVQSQP
ncbi:MAG: hypothetical protein AAF729_02250 [Pseudomonadota bacterium]